MAKRYRAACSFHRIANQNKPGPAPPDRQFPALSGGAARGIRCVRKFPLSIASCLPAKPVSNRAFLVWARGPADAEGEEVHRGGVGGGGGVGGYVLYCVVRCCSVSGVGLGGGRREVFLVLFMALPLRKRSKCWSGAVRKPLGAGLFCEIDLVKLWSISPRCLDDGASFIDPFRWIQSEGDWVQVGWTKAVQGRQAFFSVVVRSKPDRCS